MSPKISVVVPTYNQSGIIEYCLHSLFNQTADPADYEIVIVDDGSTDNTQALVKRLTPEAPCEVVYVRQPNMGRSRTRNNGAMKARGKYIIFLDGDMTVRREFVAAHLAGHTRPGLIVHGTVINTSQISDPNTGPATMPNLSRAFFATGNVSIERAQFIESGMFDEDFVEYGWEDLELGERLRRMGLKAVKSPAAWSYHLCPQVTCQGIPRLIAKEQERARMAILFHRKNPSFAVRLMTLISPVYFGWDRLWSLFHWPEHPKTMKLMQWLESKKWRPAFNFLLTFIQSHAYAEGLREELRKKR
jgi:glycosyltransferase involved in cell wall biosynthesis